MITNLAELVAVGRERNRQASENIQETRMVDCDDRCPQGGVRMR